MIIVYLSDSKGHVFGEGYCKTLEEARQWAQERVGARPTIRRSPKIGRYAIPNSFSTTIRGVPSFLHGDVARITVNGCWLEDLFPQAGQARLRETPP